MEKIRSKSKKILSVLLSMAMILSAIPLGQIRVFAADNASGPAIDGGTKTLKAISVAGAPTTVEQGKEPDTSDMLVTATYSDDSKENLSSDKYEVSLDTSALGTAVATVASTESPAVMTTFNVDVVPVGGKKVYVFDCETATEAPGDFGLWSLPSVEAETAKLTSITVTAPDKTDYKTTDTELDLTGLVVKATYSDDSTKNLTADEYTVSAPDFTQTGKQTITVTAGSVTATFDINVSAAPSAGAYYVDVFEFDDAVTSVDDMNATVSGTASISSTTVAGHSGSKLKMDKNSVITKKLSDTAITTGKVKLYTEFNGGVKSGFYNILDKDGNSLILFGQFSGTNIYEEESYTADTKVYAQSKKPYKTVAGSNQNYWIRLETEIDLDASNASGVLKFSTVIYQKEKYTDEWKRVATVTEEDYKSESIGHANGCATSALTAFSVGAVEFASNADGNYFDNMFVAATDVDGIALTGVTVTTLPDTKEYMPGAETLDLTGLVITEKYSDNSTKPISDTAYIKAKYAIAGFDSSKSGSNKITLTRNNHEDIEATFDVAILDAKIVSIEVTKLPAKTEYFVGDTGIDATGIEVTATYSNGKTALLETSEYTVGLLDATAAGKATVTITVVDKNETGENVTTTFEVTVKEPKVTGIKITTAPNKVQYQIGEKADWSGMVVSLVYENSKTKVLEDSELIKVEGFDSAKAVESQTITVTYGEYTATFNIAVIDPSVFTPVEYNFDFNIEGTNTADGWTGIFVNKKNGKKYGLADYGYSAEKGYGFNTTVTALQGRGESPKANGAYVSIPKDVYNDFVLFGNAKGSFDVDIANGTYNVMIIVGTVSSNTTTVKIEDKYTGTVTLSKATNPFAVIEIANVMVADGQMNIVTTADSNARVSGIVISNVMAPAGVKAVLDTTDGIAVNVTWNQVPGCVGYNVYRTHEGVTECIGTLEGMTATAFKDTSVDCVENYTYFVRGISAKGLETIASDEAEIAIVDSSVNAPATPDNFKIADMDKNATTLTWDASENVMYYEVYAVAKGSETPDISGYKLIKKITENTYVCDIEGHADMYFRVVAVGLGGKSQATDIAFSTAGAPKAPTNLKVSEVGDYQTTLTWDASENAAYYEIYWSDRNRTDLSGLDGYAYVGKSSTTSFVYELPTHVERYFKVVAVGAGGRSEATECVKADIVKNFEVQAEYLDRGLVAIKIDGGVYLGWRLLGDEYAAKASYILYRDGKPVRTFEATENTSFLDADGTEASKYAVSAVIDGKEGEKCGEVAVQSTDYLEVPIKAPEAYYDDKLTKDYIKSNYYDSDWYVSENILSDEDKANGTYTYAANDTYVGDVDGDGVYEIIVKWNGLSCDNSQSGYTSPVYIDCYKLDGTRLWRINLGINVRAGAHYTQPVVADLDGDGKAEVMMRTSDGTVDGMGNVIGDATADYRGEKGIITGNEYLTLFDGETGKVLDNIDYIPERGSVSSWGDNYGGRSERFLSGAAYLDGEHISAIFARGYYTRAVVVAYTVADKKIVTQWICDSNDEKNADLYGQGAHSFTVADVDGDGCQEIIYGAATIDHDGKVMYSLKGLNGKGYGGHGDALRVTDMNLQNPGLEIFMVHEEKTNDAVEMHDGATGNYIYYVGASQDVGRGAAGDIDPAHEGVETWSTIKDENGETLAGLRDAFGNIIAKRPSSVNHMAWFNGDMGREFVDNSNSVPYVGTWDYANQKQINVSFDGCRTNNTTKANAAFQADMFGDWREELAFRTEDNTAIRIYTSTETMDYRLYTLMHDPTYRAQMACNGSAYNQSPDAGFYIGYDTDLMIVPVPTLNVVKAIADEDVEVTGILVTSPDKVTYIVGEELNLDGLTVTALYNNGTKKILPDGFTVDTSKFNSSVAAEGIVITITYGKFNGSFVVKVVNAEDRQSFYYVDDSSVESLGFTVTENGSFEVVDSKKGENITNKLAVTSGTASKKLSKAISSGKVTFEHVAYQNGSVYSYRILDAEGNGLISVAQQGSGNYNLYKELDTTGSPFQKLIASVKNKWVKSVIEIDLDKSNATGVLHFTMTLAYKDKYTDDTWKDAGVFTQDNTYASAANFGFANGAATSTLTSFSVGSIEFQSAATSYVDDIFFNDGTGIGDVVTSTRTLKSIEITKPAAVTKFSVGSKLNTSGLEITGTYEITYSDGRTPEIKTAVITDFDTEYDFSKVSDNAVVKIIVTDGDSKFTKEYSVKVVPKSDGSYEAFEYIDDASAAIIGFAGSNLSVTDGEISADDKSNVSNRITVSKGTATKTFDTAFTKGTVHFETAFMTLATSKASLFLRILNSEGKPMLDFAQYGSGNLNMYIDKNTSGTTGVLAGAFKGLPVKNWAKLSVDIDLDASKAAGHLVFDATVWTTDDYASGNWTEFAKFDETLYLNSEMAPTTTGSASSDATVFDIASIELYNAASSYNYYDDMFFEAIGEGTTKVLESIEVVSEPVKKEYVEGDNFDAAGLSIVGNYKYTFKDGTTETRQRKITDYTVEFNNRTIGDSVPVVIKVGDNTVTFYVKVVASTALTGIEAYIVEYINNELVTLLKNNDIALNKRQIKLPYANKDDIKLSYAADSDNVTIENRIMTVTPSTEKATEAVITVSMVVKNADGRDVTVKKSVTFKLPKASQSKEPSISLSQKADMTKAVKKMAELGLFKDQERLNGVSTILSKLNGKITVEEFVAMLINLFEVDTTYTDTEINRDDIDYDAWYIDYVIAAFQLSVETEESRLGKESFGIGDNLTEEDILYMIKRMVAVDETDLPSDYADKMFD